jgi:DNA-binding response OmpR family regulator
MLDPVRSLNADEDGLAMAPPPPRLLVIDDDNLHRKIVCRVAARAGYAPAGAATYDEAAQLLQDDNTFDCITLDLSLGPHAGVEMLRHLWVIGCKAPIIVISGCDAAACDESVRLAKSLNLNIWESIRKPVDLTVLRYWFEQLKTEREAAAVGTVAAA